MMNGEIRIGCGVWRNADWKGSVYLPGSLPGSFLNQYASTFAAVEGNSTFYGLPRPETIQMWKASVPDNFRFCFKAPQKITHVKRLVGAEQDLRDFLNRIEPLGDNLGPIMLQFPTSFGPELISTLLAFLKKVPKNFSYTVELRHPEFLSNSDYVNMIRNDHISLCIVDSRVHYQIKGPSAENLSGHDTPIDLGNSPIVRFVGKDRTGTNLPFLRPWVHHFTHWQRENKSPYFFAHTDDDKRAPFIASHFQSLFPNLPPILFKDHSQLDLF